MPIMKQIKHSAARLYRHSVSKHLMDIQKQQIATLSAFSLLMFYANIKIEDIWAEVISMPFMCYSILLFGNLILGHMFIMGAIITSQ